MAVARALSGVRWRVLRLGRRIDSERRLVVLRGYARAEDGRLHPVQIRAMIDSGAQTEIMSPDLARRLGGKITEGRFGVAVEAFGRETPLTQQARDIELRLPGTNPRSLLAQDFPLIGTSLCLLTPSAPTTIFFSALASFAASG